MQEQNQQQRRGESVSNAGAVTDRQTERRTAPTHYAENSAEFEGRQTPTGNIAHGNQANNFAIRTTKPYDWNEESQQPHA